MNRYAMIDSYTGFVWGVRDAESPLEAAKAMDDSIQPGVTREYENGSAWDIRNGADGWFVYSAPDGFDVQDGQDKNQIAAVEALPLAAVITYQVIQD